jgi:hypothetical protein
MPSGEVDARLARESMDWDDEMTLAVKIVHRKGYTVFKESEVPLMLKDHYDTGYRHGCEDSSWLAAIRRWVDGSRRWCDQ